MTEEGYNQMIIPSQQMQQAMQQLDELSKTEDDNENNIHADNNHFLPDEQQERIQNYINQLGNKLENLTNGNNLEEQQNLEQQKMRDEKLKNLDRINDSGGVHFRQQ